MIDAEDREHVLRLIARSDSLAGSLADSLANSLAASLAGGSRERNGGQ
jgi:hypothetical protein